MPERTALPPALAAGYARFRSGAYAAARERYRRLGEGGQHPATMVVACSDSRSAPEAVFDAGPGELFVVRNVAALVPVYAPDAALHGVSAALEYAVLALGVTSVVVLGHGRCGGIAAALDEHAPLSATDFVGTWVAGLRALAEDLDAGAGPEEVGSAAGAGERRRILELRSVEESLANLRTFPWVASRERAGDLRLHGAWFDIALGELHGLGDAGWTSIDEQAG